MNKPNSAQPNPLQQALTSCRLMFRYSLIFGAAINLLMLASPLYSMQVLDRVLGSQNENTLVLLTLIIFFAIALLGIVQAARSIAMTHMGDWLESKLAGLVFANSIKMSLQSKINIGSQKIRDLQVIKGFLTSPALVAMLDTPWSVIFLIVLFCLHYVLGFMTVLGGIILIGMGIITDRITKPLIESNNEDSIRGNMAVDQATRNSEIIHVMGFIDNVTGNWQKINSKVHNTNMVVSKRQAILGGITSYIRQILQILITGVGAYLVIHGQMSSGAIIASSTLTARALAPFEQFINAWKGYINYRKSFDRLNKAFDTIEPDREKMTLPAPTGLIEAQGIFFAPKGTTKYTVRGVNFKLPAGETLVVIGNSGSGKTTLAKLIAGAWEPNSGTVRIDGANIKDWDRSQLGKYFGYLPQDIELFGGTIKQNIGRMDPDSDPLKVIAAAQLAGVHDMILSLPNAYDTEIGIDGSVLSGGQRQRLALARAFFDNPKILILDEPNSNLDSKGEEGLLTALAKAKEMKMTVILVSHRPNVISFADKILLMQDGEMRLFGNRDDVLKEMQGMAAANAPKAAAQDKV